MGHSLAMHAGMGLLGNLKLVVSIALDAMLLSVAFRWVVGFVPSYLQALAAVLLFSIAGKLLWLAMPANFNSLVLVGLFGSGLVLILLSAWVINHLLRTQTGLPVGFLTAFRVELGYIVISLAAAAVFVLILVLVFGSAALRPH